MPVQGPFGQLAVEVIEPRWRAYSEALLALTQNKPRPYPITELYHVFSEIDFQTPARVAQSSFDPVVRKQLVFLATHLEIHMARLHKWESRPESQNVTWPDEQMPSQMLQSIIDSIMALNEKTKNEGVQR